MEATLLHHLVENGARNHAEKSVLFFRDQEYSYKHVNDEVQRVSACFTEAGIEPGDRIAVYLPKQPETVISFLATSRSGAVFIPVNPILKAEQVEHILRDSKARLLVSSRTRLEQLDHVLSNCKSLQTVMCVDECPAEKGVRTIPWKTAPCSPKAAVVVDENSLAALLYTSGSTGLPKGVMLSHNNLLLGAQSVVKYLDNRPADRLLALLPFSFDYGLSQLTTALTAGGSLVLMDYLLPRDVIRAVERYQVTGLAAIPTLWNTLSKLDWPEHCVDSLRYITSSGGTMPIATTRILQEKLPNTEIVLMYGLTEAFRSTYLPPDQIDERPDSIGLPIPYAELHVLDEHNSPCAANEPGQLVHAGPLVAMGYWRNEEKTLQRFKPLPWEETPAVWSGDRVQKDEAGYYYFIGRMDEMIKTSGYRVSPAEIETVLQHEFPGIHVAAIGLTHPAIGQGILLVVEQEDESPDSNALIACCKKHLPPYMIPLAIEWIPALPLNANHKIDRPALMKQFRNYFSQS